MVYEVPGERPPTHQPRDHPIRAYQERSRAMAVQRRLGASGPGQPLVGRYREPRPGRGGGGLEGEEQGRGAGALRTAQVYCLARRGQIECGERDGAVLPVGEGQGGGGEIEPGQGGAPIVR